MKTTHTTPAITVEHAGTTYRLYTLAQANAILKAVAKAAPEAARVGNHATSKTVWAKLTPEEMAVSNGSTEKTVVGLRKLYTDEAVVLAHPEARNMWVVTAGADKLMGC
jgi:hypothetical protein